MSRDDIIRMAREAGFDPHDMSADFTCNLKDMERFAELVRAAEREACAKVCEQGLPIASSLSALDDMEMWGEKFGTAIRAREQA